MTKPLKEDFIIRIKSRIDQPAEPEGKPEYVELMTRGSLSPRGDSYYITYRETETTGYEGCVTTLKLAENGSPGRSAAFWPGQHPAADRKRPTQSVPLRDRLRFCDTGRNSR